MTDAILAAFPLRFLVANTDVQDDGDEVLLPRHVWEAWADLYPAGSPMLVEMIHLETGATRVVCAAGQFHVETNNHLYVPNWILQHMNQGDEEERHLFVRPVLETPPRATLIVLKPLDNALYDTDMRTLFEERLYTFHTLQTGTTLSVHLPELGGLEAYARVERLEPADLVVLGSEVNVEFVEPELAALAAETTDPAVLLPSAEETETAEERMARIRASWIQKMRGAGAGAQNT
jgi:hypothetical protein